MIEHTEVNNKQEWEQLVQHYPEANFLQSWNWGEFHLSLGHQVTRMAWFEAGQPVAVAAVIKEVAKRGTYLTVAGGPLLEWQNQLVACQVLLDLRTLGKTQGADFVRFRPQVTTQMGLANELKKWGALVSPMHVTADITVIVDLTPPWEDIMAGFRKSTRYEIRRAEKEGITVRHSSNVAEIGEMYQDQLDLASKHGFVPFAREFWEKQFQAFVADGQVELFHAEQAGLRLASAFVLFYNGEAVYHYATSTPANAKLPGAYACQAAIMQRAKELGCSRYNLWGIAPANQPNHRFAGVTTFKTGFSDQVVEYVPAHDLPLNSKYYLTRGFELVRRKLRRL